MRAGSVDFLLIFALALRRRAVLWRMAESLGLALAGASLLCLPVLLILLYRQESVVELLVVAGAAGVLAGLWLGIAGRPSMLATLMTADHQLRLADLLSSGWSMRQVNEPGAKWVLARATEVATNFRPAEVSFSRFSPRVWAGIGLSLAMIITLSLLSELTRTNARADDPPAGTAILASIDGPEKSVSTGLDSRANDPLLGKENANQSTDASRLVDSTTEQSDQARATRKVDGQAGSASAQTQVTQTLQKGSLDPTSGPTASGDELSAGGTGRPTIANAGGSDTGGITGAGAQAKSIPPWQSAGWPDAQRSAARALRDGLVPDAQKDLVQAYFDRR